MQVNVAGLRRNIKNLAHNYSDAQVKVREATSNDPWGPSATIMAEIAELTNNVVAFSEIMQMIWKRLNDHGKNWRHVYKALILLEYLIKTGNEKVSQQCKENIFAIQTLREFVYFEEGKDQGTHVREKAKQLVNLLKDDERLKNERVKALKAKERFAQYPSGFGSDGYIDGPTQRDMRDMPPGWQEEPTKPVSELEMVRPQTAGEEELQLQLAMAMSREEAEQEEAKRRSDDVRLQLALSQSEQDFKHQKPPKEENQSHLLDLLDIQLGATSISSPPLGLAAGGLTNTTTDPWITPARAASQMSDPWTGTASPPVDPWQPAGSASRSTPLAHLGAVGGMGALAMHSNGTNGPEGWGGGMRTQSPSVTSGSSTEGWLQTNGNTHQNALSLGGAAGGGGAAAAPTAASDAWLSKPNLPIGAATTISTVDAWLSDNNKPAAAAVPPKALISDDPWAPKAGGADPWKSIEHAATKPSPDMDEFDIITNRNKSAGDLLNINDSPTNASNNNANLLDDLDPLSTLMSSAATTNNITSSSSTGATAKKPLKDPQSFLGENSGLVNLDNLIKPAVPQNTANAAAYNPFSDTVIPPKTNLFQQQQPAVPSINQLKQQSFQMTMNQDPWAPVNNAAAPQLTHNNNTSDFIDDDFFIIETPDHKLNLNNNDNQSNNNGSVLDRAFSDDIDLDIVDLNVTESVPGSKENKTSNSKNNNKDNKAASGKLRSSYSIKYSKSDNDGFKPLLNTNLNNSLFNNKSVDNIHERTASKQDVSISAPAPAKSVSSSSSQSILVDTSDVFATSSNNNGQSSSSSHLSYPSLYPHVEIINNNDIYASLKSSPPSSPQPSYYYRPPPMMAPPLLPSSYSMPLSPLKDIIDFDFDNNIHTPITLNMTNNNNYHHNQMSNNCYSHNNNNMSLGPISSNANATTCGAAATAGRTAAFSSTSNFSHAFQASLAATPGVTIIPLQQQLYQQPSLQLQQQQQQLQSNAAATNLFSYGFFDTNTNDFNLNTQCKFENNNNMPWMKPEAAASNPFLS